MTSLKTICKYNKRELKLPLQYFLIQQMIELICIQKLFIYDYDKMNQRITFFTLLFCCF